MSERKFAAVATASDGRQVLCFVEPDGNGLVIHQIAEADGVQVDMKIHIAQSNDQIDVAVYGAIESFDTDRADRILAQMNEQLGGLMEAA